MTAQKLQIAQLAAGTLGTHLYHAFRKRGITGRGEPGLVLAAQPASPERLSEQHAHVRAIVADPGLAARVVGGLREAVVLAKAWGYDAAC